MIYLTSFITSEQLNINNVCQDRFFLALFVLLSKYPIEWLEFWGAKVVINLKFQPQPILQAKTARRNTLRSFQELFAGSWSRSEKTISLKHENWINIRDNKILCYVLCLSLLHAVQSDLGNNQCANVNNLLAGHICTSSASASAEQTWSESAGRKGFILLIKREMRKTVRRQNCEK